MNVDVLREELEELQLQTLRKRDTSIGADEFEYYSGYLDAIGYIHDELLKEDI